MSLGSAWRGKAGTPLRSVGEFGLIARLRALIDAALQDSGVASSPFITIGIGDDAASLRPNSGREILVTCDIQIAGRHFLPEWTPPRKVGERCIAVNASDIGAMGGIPRAAMVSLGLGPEVSVEDVEEIYRGMCSRLLGLGSQLIGGNVSAMPSGLFVDVTMLGEVEEGRAVRRNTAREGDLVWVTGAPGSAAAGLALLRSSAGTPLPADLVPLVEAYLSPQARAFEGRALGSSGAVSAMIDVSDGLIGDLAHLVEGRGLDVLLREEALPVGEGLKAAGAALGRPPESFPLEPSDDYELIFTTAPEEAENALAALRGASDVAAWPVGEIAAGTGRVLIEDLQGKRRTTVGRGWDHFQDAAGPAPAA